MKLNDIYNEIEEEAWKDKYFDGYLTSYLKLRKLLDSKARNCGEVGKKRYWNALNRFAYMVFENLYFLKWQLKNNYHITRHLPTFMSTFMMGFSISEYLKKMMCILSHSDTSLEREFFMRLLAKGTPKDFEERKKCVNNFLTTASSYENCSDISKKWKKYFETYEMRNTFTHAFRLPWWYRKVDKKVYGFPMSLYLDSNKIQDEIWEFITDADKWNEKVLSLSKNEFINGADLINRMHDDGCRMADTIFIAFIEFIRINKT